MNEQSKGMKVLYTVFLIVITTRTIIALYDRLAPKEKECDCKNKTQVKWEYLVSELFLIKSSC